MAVCVLTTGAPGVGKTFVRGACFLLDDFLVNTDSIYITNLPVYPDVIADEMVRRLNLGRKGVLGKITAPFRRKQKIITREDILKRIHIIPDDVLQLWKTGDSGPWEYFSDYEKDCPEYFRGSNSQSKRYGSNLQGCHIAIDEIHNFINISTPLEVEKEWSDFLGEIRHRGCTFEGITQDVKQVNPAFIGRVAVRLELVGAEDLRDPFFGIKMMDWYELKASFTGEFHKTVFEREFHQRFGRWKELHTRRFAVIPYYFKFYNSYSASLKEKEQGVNDKNRAPKYEYQRRTKLSLLSWFIFKNFFQLFGRFVVAVFLLWLCFGGGINFAISKFMSMTSQIAKSNGVKDQPVSQKSSNQSKKETVNTANDSSAFLGVPLADKNDSDLVTYPVSDLKKHSEYVFSLETQKKESDEHLKLIEAELRRIKEEQLRSYSPVFFSEKIVLLRNGLRIYKGYTFYEGEYKDKTVSLINLSERYIELSDGKRLRMQ